MARSTTFASPVHQRIIEGAQSTPKDGTVLGPLPFLNPTRARFPAQVIPDAPASAQQSSEIQVEWRSRDNRKGRHMLVLPPSYGRTQEPRNTSTGSAILSNVHRMCTVFAWWDISWWIAVLFSFGSAIFVVCGCFYWLPLVAPSSAFPGESVVGGGVTAFIGATLFEFGAVLLIIEAVNENQTGCFGWALEQAWCGQEGSTPKGGKCVHHHSSGLHRSAYLQHPKSGRKWEWWPTWHDLKTHYIYELGFLASSILALGATIFYISGVMSLPGIYTNLSVPVLDATYWLTYLLGGLLFVISSALYLLETQKRWYLPAPKVLGWWIGLWNLIGSVGWTLSAAFGFCTEEWCVYQSDLTLLWASAAFLVGSLLLWYEVMDKYPVKRSRSGVAAIRTGY